MRRPVRVPDHVEATIGQQLPADRAEVFRVHDLREAIEALSLVDWWSLPEIEQSPGIRRFTVGTARTVAGYHLLVGLDTWADDPGAVVVHVIDIWPDRWPEAT
ncbi:MAG: hypothetical protein ACFCVK_10690 [Acidimicrobiales bacterium]